MAQGYQKFVDLLLKYLEKEERSQSWLATQIGVSRATVSNWITNSTRPASPELVHKIADRLSLDESKCEELLRATGFSYASIATRANISEKEPETALDIALATLAAMPLDHVPELAAPPVNSRIQYDPNRFFVGRDEELMQLAKSVKGTDISFDGLVPTTAITGMGGIGKTQLAVEFVYRYGQFFQGGVFWLSCTDPSAISVEMAVCYEHLSKSDKDFSSSESTNLAERVKSVWQKQLPRLLIFDNCDDVAVLNDWRPKFGGCRVLITSRRHEWSPVLRIRTLSLGILERVRSIELLCQFPLEKGKPAYTEQDRIVLNNIAETLGDLPLALHLAGSFLANYGHVMSPSAYHQELNNYKLLSHLSMQKDVDEHSPTEHVTNIEHTFAISYSQLDLSNETDALAFNILLCAAHWCDSNRFSLTKDQLNLDNLMEETVIRKEDEYAVHLSQYAIELMSLFINDLLSTDLLRGLIGKGHNPVHYESALRRLVNLGLIERKTYNLMRLHPLVVHYTYTIGEAGNVWAKEQSDNFQILILGQVGMVITLALTGFFMGDIFEKGFGSPSSLIQKARELLYSHPKNSDDMIALWRTLMFGEKSLPAQSAHVDRDDDSVLNSFMTYRILSRIDEEWGQEVVERIRAIDNGVLDMVLAYNDRGVFHYNNRDYALAKADFTKATEIDLDSSISHLNRAVICCIQGDLEQALSDYSRAIELDSKDDAIQHIPHDLVQHIPQADYSNQDEYNQAIADHLETIDIQLNLATLYVNRGYEYWSQGNNKQALIAFVKATKLSPNEVFAYSARAEYYSTMNEYALAIADYTKMIQLRPTVDSYYRLRGSSCFSLNEYEKAIADFTKAIELAPIKAGGYQSRGIAFNAQGEYELALADLTKVIELTPDHAFTYYIRGNIYYDNGDSEQALTDYRQALVINSQLPRTWSNHLSKEDREQVEQRIKELEAQR